MYFCRTILLSFLPFFRSLLRCWPRAQHFTLPATIQSRQLILFDEYKKRKCFDVHRMEVSEIVR